MTWISRVLIFVYTSFQLTSDLAGKKVGLVKEGFAVCDEDVQTIVRAAAFELRQTGADVEEISIPLHAHGK